MEEFNNLCQVQSLWPCSKIISAVELFLSQYFSSRLLPWIAKAIFSVECLIYTK